MHDKGRTKGDTFLKIILRKQSDLKKNVSVFSGLVKETLNDVVRAVQTFWIFFFLVLFIFITVTRHAVFRVIKGTFVEQLLEQSY